MDQPVIACRDVGKMFKLYERPLDKVLDVLGVSPWLFWRKTNHREFWALRNFSLEVARGERLGVIGHNGAGKSTLLKLVTGNLQATAGSIHVAGRVQALLELGTGFHPEFTGRQNIRAALSFQGLGRSAIAEKEEEVVEFAELKEFIDQPIRTYSAGMYARLAFAVATSIEPDILIIDEILGAGDAYFYGKCVERMRRLTVDKGATVLFVSHDLQSVLALCDRAIWLKQGRIVADGEPLKIVKDYYAEVQREENLRLLKNKAAEVRNHESGISSQVSAGEGVPRAEAPALPGADKSIVTWMPRDPRIEYVRFLDATGNLASGIEEGSDLTIEIGYFSSAPIADPVFALTIYRADGINLCHANTVLGGIKIEKLHGFGKVRFLFRPFMVGPGEYLLSCSIFKHLDPSINAQPPYYDQHDRAHRFRVWKKLGVALNLGLVRIPYRIEHVTTGSQDVLAEAG